MLARSRTLDLVDAVDGRAPEVLLQPGEVVMWRGCPDVDVWLAPGEWWAILVMSAVTLFALMLTALAALAGSMLALVPALVAVLGVYLDVLRLVVRRRRKARTLYVLTNRRAIVAVEGRLWRESPWRDRERIVRRRRSHVTVAFHGPVGPLNPVGTWRRSGWYQDRGWFLVGRPELPGVQFFDVADGDGLLAAVDRASPTGTLRVSR